MNNIDKIFIISLNNNLDNCKKILNDHNLNNYEIINFVETYNIREEEYKNFSHKYLKFKKLINNIDEYIQIEYFIKKTLLNILILSLEKNYNNILVLDNNFILTENFFELFKKIFAEAENNYFGMLYLSDINSSTNKIKFNEYLYKINGIHDNFAVCYNKRIFETLINFITDSDCELDKIFAEYINSKYMVFVSNPILIKNYDNKKILNRFTTNIKIDLKKLI